MTTMNAETDKTGVRQDNSFEHLAALAETGRDEDVKEAVASLHPADVAELINLLERSEIKSRIFRVLAPDVAPTVLSLVSPLARETIVQDLSVDHLRQILEELDSDDAADLLGSIPKERAQSILAGLPGPLSARIQQLLRYPADTAGGLMQSEYAAVLEGATVEEAVEIVRTLAEAVSNIHNVFVVDHRFHLLGVLPLARLILARAGQTVDAVMDRQVVSVTVDTDQEEVAQLFRKYDLLSLPVTDPRGALLGRITVDDVVDVLEEEASEDFAKLSGLGQEEPIFDSPGRTIRRRLPWLGLNLLTTSVSASVIGLFQGTIETIAIAAALMTIVAAQGGNAGVQTLTVMVRGLALGQITPVHARGILVKELAVACGNGMALGLAAGVSGFLLHRNGLLAVVLGLALLINYLVAALVASLIPLTLHRLRADPAVASSVFVTACTDLCGFFAFLGLLSVGLRYFG
jgi:magnesium transporter